MNHDLRTTILAALAVATLFPLSAHAAGGKRSMPKPDFTAGDAIPEGATHDWNLGATGARGWMFSDQLETSDARQIRITEVAKGSPADGVLAIGDVILGVAGKPFSYDARVEFGKALTVAESETGGGKRHRIDGCLAALAKYGGAAKPLLPELRRLEQDLLAHREAKGLQPQIAQLRRLIKDIEHAAEVPELRSLK